jgi:DNA-binding GntR family transcriptional regulator
VGSRVSSRPTASGYALGVSLEPSESASNAVASLHRGGSRLNHAVYDQLKERLLEGRYTAGERLSTEALRTEFGVSKQPVMEAMRRLAGDGLIEIVPQVGSRVATFGPREVSDFFVMFGGFEGTIAGIAALRRTERQLDELENISARIGALRSSPDTVDRAHGYRVLNRRFHHAIHDMAHSRIMADTSLRMWDLSDFLINTSDVPQPFSAALDDRHADHERILAALHASDQETARAEMEKHIVGTVDVIRTGP